LRCVVVLWCLVSIWGCAHPLVQPAKEEHSAIAFAKQVVTEMSTGLDKVRSSVTTTVTNKGDYRVFTAELFPHNVTLAQLMENFARFCTQIGATMSQSVCTSNAQEAQQVRFVVHAEQRTIRTRPMSYVVIYVTVYEPVGTPSEEFLQAIRPYR